MNNTSRHQLQICLKLAPIYRLGDHIPYFRTPKIVDIMNSYFDLLCHLKVYHLVGNGGRDEIGEELAGAGGDRPRVRGVARLPGRRPRRSTRVVEEADGDRAQPHQGAVPRVLGICLEDGSIV